MTAIITITKGRYGYSAECRSRKVTHMRTPVDAVRDLLGRLEVFDVVELETDADSPHGADWVRSHEPPSQVDDVCSVLSGSTNAPLQPSWETMLARAEGADGDVRRIVSLARRMVEASSPAVAVRLMAEIVGVTVVGETLIRGITR